ncbi:EAL domain-containing protein [Bacillus alkalicellulosilyticus]|uniref:EAL domain-containing protein n=1 Tax=Alkalihalobacterium alkalicellulosilyticum TaxID=1912214 RepID=UPI000996F8B6|nr:EAL domain-containing protein [Bacillus alkalicellulosilyticus]
MEELTGSYNLWLVALSLGIAIFAAYTALDLAGRVIHSKGIYKRGWLLGGSVAMGIGIWSMHFIGMIAFQLPMVMSYQTGGVIKSIIFAFVGSFIALYVVSSSTKLSKHRLIIGGITMGAAISTMHYVGMDAMEGMSISYDPYLFLLSIVVAVIVSIVALKIAFELARIANSKLLYLMKVTSALVMGAAIAGMHYIGMAAASFSMYPHEHVHESGLDMNIIAVSIALCTLLVQSFLVLGVFTERRLHSQAQKLITSELRYRSLVDNNLDMIFSMDTKGQFISLNKSGLEIIKVDDLTKIDLRSLFTRDNWNRVKKEFCGVVRKGKPVNFETCLEINQSTIFINVMLVPIYLDDQLDSIYGIARDITSQEEAKKKIFGLAYTDQLTGLPNRRYLIDEINRGLKTNKKVAVYFLDLNRFKVINDALGHSVGDELLQVVATRLGECLNGEGILGRLGGDEFTILLPSLQNLDQPTKLAQKIISEFSKPIDLKGRQVHTSVSIGIAVSPNDGDTADVLMKRADIAMYASKKRGESTYSYYSATLSEKTESLLLLEEELLQGIDRDEFFLVFQPQINASQEGVLGVEALVRWLKPDGSIKGPGEFIPLAEESGLILPLGNKILHLAFEQAQNWLLKGTPIRVSINLSPKQFQNEFLVEEIERLITQYQLPPELIELEVTESMTMENRERSIAVLQNLNNLGVQLAIDDFGTGHSSLQYLKDFPIHRLKIDRSFISEIAENPKSKQITSAIILLGKALNLEVTAEGVETIEQLKELSEHPSISIQGYYFSRPVSHSEIEKNYLS